MSAIPARQSPPSPAEATGPRVRPIVLVVDDASVERRKAGGLVEESLGWRVAYAEDGVKALEAIRREAPDVVLTDLQMPQMDGLELVKAIRGQYPLLPVVLMTAHGSEEVALQALRHGAASYVPKRSLSRDLAETLEQVVAAARTSLSHQRLLASMTRTESEFSLENDPTLVPALVTLLQETLSGVGLCGESDRVRISIALSEALTNAMYHGNLELRSELRETDEKQYYRLGAERRIQPPFGDRRVFVKMAVSHKDAVFVVRDEGPGFDPATLPDPTDPANLGRVSGRGLLLIQTFMDRVEHNSKGNEITMVKHVQRG